MGHLRWHQILLSLSQKVAEVLAVVAGRNKVLLDIWQVPAFGFGADTMPQVGFVGVTPSLSLE